MKKVNELLKKITNKKYIIILDNFRGHKIKELFDYYKKEKLNIVFNIPYCSYFNCMQLCFRGLKQIFYSNIYNSTTEMKEDIKEYFESPNINKTLLLNYIETLLQYLSDFNEYRYKNLNNYY